MTEHQKRMATFWISGKRRLRRDSQQRFLTNGDRVRFTKIIYEGYDNIEFEINDCPDWSIWFSQLNLVHVTAEIAGFAVPFILGGITGGLLAPAFYPRPIYPVVRPYPYPYPQPYPYYY